MKKTNRKNNRKNKIEKVDSWEKAGQNTARVISFPHTMLFKTPYKPSKILGIFRVLFFIGTIYYLLSKWGFDQIQNKSSDSYGLCLLIFWPLLFVWFLGQIIISFAITCGLNIEQLEATTAYESFNKNRFRFSLLYIQFYFIELMKRLSK